MAKVSQPDLKRFLDECIAVNIQGGRKVPELKCPVPGAQVVGLAEDLWSESQIHIAAQMLLDHDPF